MWNQWCNSLPVMSLQSARDFVVPLLHWCVVQTLTLRGVPKLDLMHCSYYYTFFFLFFFFLKKHPCKYFSVLQKNKTNVCTVLLGGQVLLHFFKKRVWLVPRNLECFCCCFKIKVYNSLLFAENQSYFFENHNLSLLIVSSIWWHLHIFAL